MPKPDFDMLFATFFKIVFISTIANGQSCQLPENCVTKFCKDKTCLSTTCDIDDFWKEYLCKVKSLEDNKTCITGFGCKSGCYTVNTVPRCTDLKTECWEWIPKCGIGESCRDNSDCESGNCDNNFCNMKTLWQRFLEFLREFGVFIPKVSNSQFELEPSGHR